MGMEKVIDLESALELVLPDLDKKAKIVVIPDGGMVIGLEGLFSLNNILALVLENRE